MKLRDKFKCPQKCFKVASKLMTRIIYELGVEFKKCRRMAISRNGAVVAAQLVERLLPTPEIRSSKLATAKIYLVKLLFIGTYHEKY